MLRSFRRVLCPEWCTFLTNREVYNHNVPVTDEIIQAASDRPCVVYKSQSGAWICEEDETKIARNPILHVVLLGVKKTADLLKETADLRRVLHTLLLARSRGSKFVELPPPAVLELQKAVTELQPCIATKTDMIEFVTAQLTTIQWPEALFKRPFPVILTASRKQRIEQVVGRAYEVIHSPSNRYTTFAESGMRNNGKTQFNRALLHIVHTIFEEHFNEAVGWMYSCEGFGTGTFRPDKVLVGEDKWEDNLDGTVVPVESDHDPFNLLTAFFLDGDVASTLLLDELLQVQFKKKDGNETTAKSDSYLYAVSNFWGSVLPVLKSNRIVGVITGTNMFQFGYSSPNPPLHPLNSTTYTHVFGQGFCSLQEYKDLLQLDFSVSDPTWELVHRHTGGAIGAVLTVLSGVKTEEQLVDASKRFKVVPLTLENKVQKIVEYVILATAQHPEKLSVWDLPWIPVEDLEACLGYSTADIQKTLAQLADFDLLEPDVKQGYLQALRLSRLAEIDNIQPRQ